MLHHVSDLRAFKSLEPYSITNKKFLALLDFIESNNFKTLTFFDLNQRTTEKKVIILTFDDCSKELLSFAIPELIKRNMKAVFFIPTDFIGSYNKWDVEEGKGKVDFFTYDDVVNLSCNSNFEIGSHSQSHRKLNQLPNEAILLELKESKLYLEQLIKKNVISFAHPFGEFPLENDNLLEQAGYNYGCGIYVKNSSNFALRRFIYHNGDNILTLKIKCSFFYRFYRLIRDKF